MTTPHNLKYRRILLKLSGEAFAPPGEKGVDVGIVKSICDEIIAVHNLGVEVGVVIGGGNIFRGFTASQDGMNRVTGDHMGMLATIINALAIQESLESRKIPTRVMTAIGLDRIAEPYIQRRAISHLQKKHVVVFAGGTGNPFFTTDTAASLRAMEIHADIIIKGTKVDGVYTADPVTNPDATKITNISHWDVLKQKLNVMDATAITLANEQDMPIVVFNIFSRGDLERIVRGEDVGSLVRNEKE